MNRSKTMEVALKADGYEEWIRSIKERIQRARVKASMLVNSEQTLLCWDIGHDILEKQGSEGWGTKVVERMSADLKEAFPDMTGLSPRNLKYMRAFADAWTRKEIVQAPLAQLPWYHHLALLECLKSRGDRIAYAALAIENLNKPIGVSTYRLGLPPIEQLQAQLRKVLTSTSRNGDAK